MEITATHLTAVALVISFIVWLLRLEAKVQKTSEHLQDCQDHFNTHISRTDIHHNAERFAEFEKRIDERFAHFAASLVRVESYVEEIDGKLDRIIDRNH